jgi:hypothetical protein|eukprot:COSAG01_NODE_1914_length_8922_cov_10.562734_4_plen_54_part_00
MLAPAAVMGPEGVVHVLICGGVGALTIIHGWPARHPPVTGFGADQARCRLAQS